MRLFRTTPPGFMLSVAMQVDPDTNESVQLSTNAPLGATADQLAELLGRMRLAGWKERLAANERVLTRAEVQSRYRARRVAEFKAEGKPVDEQAVADEDRIVNAQIISLAARNEADRMVLNGGG